MKSYCVYIHTSPNNKRYVGQTCQTQETRWNEGKNYTENPYFTNAINKYGWNSFQHQVVASNLTYEQADKLEKSLIKKFKCRDPEYGYNIQGGGHNGQVHSEETKLKLSAKMSEIYKNGFTEKHRNSISKGKTGKPSSSYSKVVKLALKNAENLKGKPLSEEHKEKISNSKKGKPGRKWTDEDRKRHSERMKEVYSVKSL